MDRAGAVTQSERAGVHRSPSDEFVLPSRGKAISSLAFALDARQSPLLLTGEPGAGKTWVCGALRNALPACWRWASIDLSPAIVEGELYRLILHAVGIDPPGSQARSRAALEGALADSSDDGLRWGLVVEEAQSASPGVLEELRILGNRLGETMAFTGLILVGQSLLTRRLATRPLAPLSARISTRVHLKPLEFEELRGWLARLEPGRDWHDEAVDRLLRETGGNPRQVLSRAERRVVAPSRPTAHVAGPTPPLRAMTVVKPAPYEPAARTRDWEVTPVSPPKPPLQIGDGMIEVGWAPTPQGPARSTDREFAGESFSAPVVVKSETNSRANPAASSGSEEVIDDHYAALQAWTEWSQNQGREPVASSTASPPAESPMDLAGAETDELDPDENPSSRVVGHPSVRAEGQHEFAPYSQLFSRLRQAKDSQ